tara:strand:- start:439 stop:591 length:153 start_codon:yes stop_codon:yes gene_type:complete
MKLSWLISRTAATTILTTNQNKKSTNKKRNKNQKIKKETKIKNTKTNPPT